MVFDLGRAMRKKAEHETARLLDFEFRMRVRATRMLLSRLGLDETVAASLLATMAEDAALAHVTQLAGTEIDSVTASYRDCLTIAHRQLVAERGDPTPHRLA